MTATPPSLVRAIVLSVVKYGESSLVVNAFTEEHGRRGYVCSAPKVRRGASVSSALLPLAYVSFVASSRPHASLRRMRDVHLVSPFVSLPFNPLRRSVAMFIAELLVRTLPDEVPDPELFDFLVSSISAFDAGLVKGEANFHLFVMMRLSAYLGFAPDVRRDSAPLFDMQAGAWTSSIPVHSFVVSGRMADAWHALSQVELDGLNSLSLSRADRHELIDLLSQYFRLHHPRFSELRSHEVFKQLMS